MCKNVEMKWDDVRITLAIARTGSLSAAGRHLGLSQTTMARRLGAFEAVVGDRIFTRDRGAFRPTVFGLEVLERAELAEARMLDVEHLASSRAPTLPATVRLTAVESLIATYLVPRIPTLGTAHPGLTLELIGASDNLNLTRRDADMALRLARPTAGDLVVRKLTDLGYAVYGARKRYGDGLGIDLRASDWIAFDDALGDLPEMRWLRKLNATPPRLLTRHAHSLAAAIRAGIGAGILPCHAGDPEPSLVRLSGPEPILTRELWLLLHPELRETARIRAVCDWLDDAIARDAALLDGHPMAHAATM